MIIMIMKLGFWIIWCIMLCRRCVYALILGCIGRHACMLFLPCSEHACRVACDGNRCTCVGCLSIISCDILWKGINALYNDCSC